MARDEFAASIGRNQRKVQLDRGYSEIGLCVSTNPISIAGADMAIPVGTMLGIDLSGVAVGDTLYLLKMRNRLICIGYEKGNIYGS